MIEQSSKRFVAMIAILLLVTTPLTVLPHQAHAASQTGVMIALYTYPGSTWDVVAQAKSAHPSVPVIAIINPNNGPGSSRDANYVSGIQELHAAGVIVLGYDATGYASNSASSVKSVMNTWKSLYNIDGIFFDEMANWSGPESYYSDLTSYAKSLGYTMTVGNPGTDTLPSYIGTVDNLMIYENPGLPALSALQGWHTGYDKSNFSMIAFGVNSISQSFLTSASNYVGYIDLTNDVLDNPYDTVPPYFGTLVADLDTGSVAPTAPSAPTGLAATATSSSQINLSWTAPSNNGGSAITGYKIERSLDNGSTWNTIVSNTGSVLTTYSNTGLTASTPYTYRVSAINPVGSSTPSSIASATTTSGTVTTVPQQPTGLATSVVSSSQINLSWTAPVNNGGSAITGYKIEKSTDAGTTWVTISANTASVSTTYSDTGLTASTPYTYRVSAINPVGTGSPSNTASATTLAASTGGTVSITVKSVNLAGVQFNGMWVELHASNGTTLATGYTPVTFQVTSGNAYTIVSSNYQSNVFNHWNDGTTTASKTITPTQNTTLTEYYSTGPVSLKVKAVDLSGNVITGLWTTLVSGGTTLQSGYTTMTFSVTPGTQYTVTVANYQNYVFDHWSDGNTNPHRTITPTQAATLVAYYNS
ncbi:putative spherulin 4 [Nitrosotalea devaniterrae]|uniref:Putative spherulin 4 n=1 Tax=Nitrosotalea devaniterrae TaxID=1078905 RepID=A0A128A4H1_9ARCH|nr:putative spherulin 4 [Candidatus Nitrosotalea devanaterra]